MHHMDAYEVEEAKTEILQVYTRWNNNENNELLEIKPTPREWKQSLKNKNKRRG